MMCRYLAIMMVSVILLHPVFLFNAHALDFCTEGSKEGGLSIYVESFKDVPENNFVDFTYITNNGDQISYAPAFIKNEKHPIIFFIPYKAKRFKIRTWEKYHVLTGEMENMVEESHWIDQSQEGWPKQCVHEIPVY